MKNFEQIKKWFDTEGYNIPRKEDYDNMELWKEWYKGNVEDFHEYTAKLADGSVISCERLTMNMAKKICEDFSKLLWTEKALISLDTTKKTTQLWNILDDKKNNFSISFPQSIEKACGLGTGVIIEYLVDDEVMIEYINGDTIIPINNKGSFINGFASVSFFEKGYGKSKRFYTHFTFHSYEAGIYTKFNRLFKSTKPDLLGKEIDFNEEFPKVLNPVIYETDTPHFQIIKPPIVNNYNLDSSMGISVFGNSLDKLKAIDLKYDSFYNEFELGKKRILVDKTAIKSAVQVDANGNLTNVSYFDKDDKVYVAVNGMEGFPVKEIDMSLRYQEHIESINADLNYLSSAVGFGQDEYTFAKDGVKTATEVISENSDKFRTKQNYQIIIKDVLYDVIKSVLFLAGIKNKDINIVFDDSIIEDTDAIITRGLTLLNAGTISKETFLRDYLKYTPEQIIEEMAKMTEENKTVMPSAVDFTDFN